MDIRTFYEIYRKKSPTEKLDLLIKQLDLKAWDEHSASTAQNQSDRDYFYSEADHMRERARWLRWELREVLKEVS